MERNDLSSCSQSCLVSQHCVISTSTSNQVASSPVRSHNQTETVLPLTFPQSKHYHFPCLPVSTGSIQKPAETRSVNSSPRSYRLMPASVESSDTTSFVEKSSHPNHTPMKVMLDVAELWKLSKRSELECNFTLAKSKLLLDTDHYIKEATKRSPICHPSILPTHVNKKKCKNRKWNHSEHSNSTASGRRLFAFVKIFFGAKELDDSDPIGAVETLKQELDNGVVLTMNFLKQMQVHSAKTKSPNWMTIDQTKPGNFALAPLVKRLSVSDQDDLVKIRVENDRNCVKQQTSTKRPSSSPDIECDDAPVNKKALSNSELQHRSFHPG